MQARYYLWPCPSVCPSVRHKSLFYKNDWTDRFEFLHIDLSYAVLYRNSGIFKNKGTSLGNFVPNYVFKNFATARLYRHKCCQLRWTPSVMNCRRSSVTSLSPWASTFVYNTIGVRPRVARSLCGSWDL